VSALLNFKKDKKKEKKMKREKKAKKREEEKRKKKEPTSNVGFETKTEEGRKETEYLTNRFSLVFSLSVPLSHTGGNPSQVETRRSLEKE